MTHGEPTLTRINNEACGIKEEIPASGTITISRHFPPINSLERRIYEMNQTFEAPCHQFIVAGDASVAQRIKDFHGVLTEEVDELLDTLTVNDETKEEEVNMVALADTLGDIVVFAFSEARRHGIPLSSVVHLILDSMHTKLVDGKPLWNEERTKFIKGPNYVPPEPAIYDLFYKIDIQPSVDPATQLRLLREQLIQVVYNTQPIVTEGDSCYHQGVQDLALDVLAKIPE